MPGASDETLDRLLRGLAKTPEVTGIRPCIGPGFELVDRFRITKKLGAGGMGQVFAAFDKTRQCQVALKVLGSLTPYSIGQLKSEFRAAAELVHPNLVRLDELFSDDTGWFFTMELVEGASLPELPIREAPAERFQSIFVQLARGLRALHLAGTIHADLKPSNFLVTSKDDRVVLLDFGLARPIGLNPAGEWAGTPAYMAPEQVMGETLTAAADWYAYGVVLYEALTGALPLRNPSSRALSDAPAELRELCLDLLRLDPRARPTGDEVLRRIGNQGDRPPLSIAPPSRAVFVGRERELARLNAAWDVALSGQPAIVLLHGPSGIGKTALVSHWLDGARRAGALVLAGSCKERESMAYKAVDGLLDDVVKALDDLPAGLAAGALPNGMSDLTILFPALRMASSVAALPAPRPEASDHGVRRLRAILAFRELLARLSGDAPLILWIDDVQWSDADSAKLLGPLLDLGSAIPVLFVASYRPSAAGRGPLLDALFTDKSLTLPPPGDVPVGPLQSHEAEHLARQLLATARGDAGEVARNIGRDAGGHPLFIAELAYAAEASRDAPAAATLSELITERVAALPSSARGLLETASVAGTSLPRSVLRLTQRLSAADADAALDVLKATRLARSLGLRDDSAVDVHHDRIRDIVLQNLDPDQRRQCHLTLADALATSAATTPDFLATHYQAAGEPTRAAGYWLLAADDAARSLAFAHAANLYERGLEHAKLVGDALRAVQVKRAEALAHAGKGSAAADVFLSLAEGSPPDEAIELTQRAAEQLMLSGHLERGTTTIDRVLSSIGMRTMRSGYQALLSVVFGRALVRLRGLGYVLRTEAEVDRTELVRLDASWTVTCSLGVVDPLRGAEFQSKHLLLALRAGEPRRLLRALTVEVAYAAVSGAGSEQRTRPLLSIADDLARETGDDAGRARLKVCKGLVAYLQGRLATALAELRGAIDALTQHPAGTIWETITAQRFVIASLFFMGRLKSLAEYVPSLLAQAEGTGNLYASMCFRTAYSWGCWFAKDDVPEVKRQLARARDEWKTTGYHLCHCNILIADAYTDLYASDPESALRRLQEQWADIEAARLPRVGVLRVQLWQLRAAAAAASAGVLQARGDLDGARRMRREARHFNARLSRDRMGRAAPASELIESALRHSEGDHDGAREQLERAIAGFEGQSMALFAAAARARLGALIGGQAGTELLAAAHSDFRTEGVVNVERMIEMLAPGFQLSP